MEERKRGYRWLVLAILCFSQFLVGVSIYALPPLFPEMMGDIPLTKTQMGAVMGSIPIAAVFLTLIGGTVSDRIGSKWSYGMAVMLIGLGGGAARLFRERGNAHLLHGRHRCRRRGYVSQPPQGLGRVVSNPMNWALPAAS